MIRRDGILMASIMSKSTTIETKNACAIMSATIIGAAKNITKRYRLGFPKRVIIQAKSGHIIISEAGNKALLVCVVNPRGKHTPIFESIEKATHRIDALL